MARFPQTEPEIAALGLLMAEGLGQAGVDFPAPPVPANELQAKLDAYNEANAATVVAETAFRQHHAEKDEALEELSAAMKADLRYAEFSVRDQPEKLNQIGWGRRSEMSPLQAPGEVRDIGLKAEGDDWIILRWKAPADGGAVGVYQIQRKRDGESWEDVTISTATEHLVNNQPRGVELNFRVLAVNKAGVGQPSATVTVVL